MFFSNISLCASASEVFGEMVTTSRVIQSQTHSCFMAQPPSCCAVSSFCRNRRLPHPAAAHAGHGTEFRSSDPAQFGEVFDAEARRESVREAQGTSLELFSGLIGDLDYTP
jgi:hypothetical protein